jgi:hypothetical protein
VPQWCHSGYSVRILGGGGTDTITCYPRQGNHWLPLRKKYHEQRGIRKKLQEEWTDVTWTGGLIKWETDKPIVCDLGAFPHILLTVGVTIFKPKNHLLPVVSWYLWLWWDTISIEVNLGQVLTNQLFLKML